MYIASKGGEQAIQQAEKLFHKMKGRVSRDFVAQVMQTMPYLVDRVMGEASLYAPDLAALALAQSGGDLYEAVLLLRAYRSTQPRVAYARPVTPEAMLTLRRISASFKDIPGGQVLGPTLDYSHRVLHLDVLDSDDPAPRDGVDAAADSAAATYPPVADWLRAQGLMDPLPDAEPVDAAEIPDVTRDPVTIPAPRAHRLQALARADTGGMLALGYASMRGYGLIHPTVNELKLAQAEVQVTHPVTGERFSAGRVRVSQAEIVTKGAGTTYSTGFAATLGWNEVKLIAGATLDMEMNQPQPHPAHTEDFVLYHTEPVESSGFCIHFKLPHYVTFSSSMDSMRKVIATFYGGKGAASSASTNGNPAAAQPQPKKGDA